MGYILPVNHYQYQDYHTRMNRVRQNGTKNVDQAFKVILEKQHENVRSKYQRYYERSPKLSPQSLEHGKGQNFQTFV